MAEVLIINRSEMEKLLTLEALLPVIERAFVAFTDGQTVAYPVVREPVSAHRGIFGIKSGYLMEEGVIGLKAGGFWLDNPDAGLTRHQSTTVMFDPATGLPTAFMDGNHITAIRTAAVGALAARELARQDARTAAILGCGMQGVGQAEALCLVRPIEEIRAFDIVPENVEQFGESLRPLGVEVKACSDALEAVRGADIVVTVTPAKEPILRSDWIEKSVHVSAFGADTRDKNEVEAALFRRAKVVVDDVTQATTLGDTHHAVDQGLFRADDIHATLGEILAGQKNGRTSDDEITLLDATGLAFQDLVAGALAVKLAAEQGAGTRVSLDAGAP
jgi:alanine dehydrogenase